MDALCFPHCHKSLLWKKLVQPWSLRHSMLRKGFNGAVPELQLNHRSAPQARAWGREQWGCTRCQAHPCPLLAVPCGLGRSGRRALHRAVLVLRMGTGSGIPCMRLQSAGGQWGCPVEICAEGSHLEPPHVQRSVWGHLLWCWGCTVPLITPRCCWRSGRVPQAMSRGGAGAAALPAGPGSPQQGPFLLLLTLPWGAGSVGCSPRALRAVGPGSAAGWAPDCCVLLVSGWRARSIALLHPELGVTLVGGEGPFSWGAGCFEH